MSKATQFMDCFGVSPVIGKLDPACWGAAEVGPRDQDNGLEDKDLAQSVNGSDHVIYWDGAIFKDEETDQYIMFAARWDEKEGHWGWPQSKAIYATSDNLYGPYTDQGLLYPDIYEGYGHNVFPLRVHEGEEYHGRKVKYAIALGDTFVNCLKGAILVSDKLTEDWELVGQMQFTRGEGTTGQFQMSNVGVVACPDGTYLAYNRRGDIAVADSILGPWTTKVDKLWDKMPLIAHKHDVEDPVMWYSNGLFHCICNRWDERRAYYMISKDGINDWKMMNGTAYTPDGNMIRYEDGTENHWNKLERPNIYMEDGRIIAMTLSVIDVPKEHETGYDGHGSKIVVMPFDFDKLVAFDQE